MHCSLCYTELAQDNNQAAVQFCCDEHRKEWESIHGRIITLAPQLPLRPPEPVCNVGIATRPAEYVTSIWPYFPSAGRPQPRMGAIRASEDLLPLELPAKIEHPLIGVPACAMAFPNRVQPYSGIVSRPRGSNDVKPAEFMPHSGKVASGSWAWLSQVWTQSPSDLKVMTIALPLFALLAMAPALPKVKVKVPQVAQQEKGVQKVFAQQWETVRTRIAERAAVEYVEDFRSGLDEWESRNNKIADWSYDATGSVRPASLAIYQPSVDMTDYRFELLGVIDNKALGCAFRATDTDNYYAVKLEVTRPGPLPEVHVRRYAVIRGRTTKIADHILPIQVRTDTLYRVEIDVHGNDFTIMAQGKVVDFFSDATFQRGGVGLFCGRGEAARVRWVEVSHQHDALGRFCAYLAPLGSTNVAKGGTLN